MAQHEERSAHLKKTTAPFRRLFLLLCSHRPVPWSFAEATARVFSKAPAGLSLLYSLSPNDDRAPWCRVVQAYWPNHVTRTHSVSDPASHSNTRAPASANLESRGALSLFWAAARRVRQARTRGHPEHFLGVDRLVALRNHSSNY